MVGTEVLLGVARVSYVQYQAMTPTMASFTHTCPEGHRGCARGVGGLGNFSHRRKSVRTRNRLVHT